jgi:hypothetical protein
MRKILIIGKHKTSFTLRLAKLVTRLGGKCAIIDLTDTEEFAIVTEAQAADVVPYYWGEVTICRKEAELDEEVDVMIVIADRQEVVDLNDYDDAIVVTDYLLRDAKVLSVAFENLFADHRKGEKNGKGKPAVKSVKKKKAKKKKNEDPAEDSDSSELEEVQEEETIEEPRAKTHLSLVVTDYVEVRYTTRAILHKLGIVIPSEDVLVIYRNAADMKADVALDLGNEIRFKKLSKEYRMALGGVYRMCNPDITSEELQKQLGIKGL